jgi:pimeloyl-ACP methyl ester carboxylesterase
VDLSGHGDSDWRENYGPRHFGRDVAGVIAQLVDGPVTLVGHSMGGLASIVAAADPRSKVDSLVLLDSILRPPSRRRIGTWPVGSRGHHSTSEAARARFRLVPAQPSLPAEIVDPVAERAVVRADAGWTWKFDPRARVAFDDEYVDRQLAGVTCAITYAYGSDSKLRTRDARDELLKKQPDTRIERVEGGHHHLPLDSPRQCVDIIRAAAMVSHADDSAI